MMPDKSKSEGSRLVLGDISNQLGKRELEKSRVKGFTQNSKRFRFTSRPCTGINALKGNVIVGISKFTSSETASDIRRSSIDTETEFVQIPKPKLDDSSNDEEEQDVTCVTIETDVSLDKKSIDPEVVNDSCPSFEQSLSQETVELSQICNGSKVDHCTNNFVSIQSGSIDSTILHDSQESRVVGSDVSGKGKKLDEAISMGDSIKTCSCSFCSKAGLIWLDLHYQDIKARTSAVKKSHRDASVLAEKSFRSKLTKETINRVSNMEAHLMHQWRSLFRHTANIWEKESKELEASLFPLSDLRNKCINDFETNNHLPSEKL